MGTSKSVESSRNRIVVAGLAFALAFCLVSLRLIEVTALHAEDSTNRPTLLSEDGQPRRGEIFDRNGVLLATSLSTASLYANPRQIRDPAAAAQALAKVIPGLNAQEAQSRLSLDRSFVWIRRKLSPRQEHDVNALGIPGLYFQVEEQRVYPHGSLAGHVLGLTDIDSAGLSGVEKQFEDTLSAGQRLDLALDIRIQNIVRNTLLKTIDHFEAIGGIGIVLDVDTNEVVALVSLPDFDPNSPGNIDPDAMFNRATLGVYEMGSTFKLFTAAMALESHQVSLTDKFDASKPIRISRFTINDFHAKNRWLSVPEIMIFSSNIGAVRMALQLGTDFQREMMGRFGMLSAASIELPEVGQPLVPNPWREINTMTISFGHGLSVSPLQLVSGVSTIVNGGIRRPTTILKRRTGDAVSETRILSPETSQKMRWLMRQVVTMGSGGNANAEGYPVGGKTGSAEKAAASGYKRKALLSSFVGAFPIDDPRYAVLVTIDEPQGQKDTFGYATGGWVAAPAVGEIVERSAPLLGVKPREEMQMLPNADLLEAQLAVLKNKGR